jgi:hypothetical protein
MIREFIERWEKNKHKLEEYFRTTKQEEYDAYSKIVVKLFELVINDSRGNGTVEFNFNTEEMTIINNGNYSGTEIFILYNDTCEPDISDYVVTHNYYGSCSGCDILLSISNYDVGFPNDDQVKEYMTLALHLVQRCKWLSE